MYEPAQIPSGEGPAQVLSLTDFRVSDIHQPLHGFLRGGFLRRFGDGRIQEIHHILPCVQPGEQGIPAGHQGLQLVWIRGGYIPGGDDLINFFEGK